MDKYKKINLSDSDFYQKIVNKYQLGKGSLFRFPMMVFCKNTGRLVSQKINMDILFRLHIYNQNIDAPLIAKTVQEMKGLFSSFGTEKLIPQFIVKPALLKSKQGVNKVFQLAQGEILKRLLLYVNISMSQVSIVSFIQSVFSRFRDSGIANHQLLNYVQIAKPQTKEIRGNLIWGDTRPDSPPQKGNAWTYHSLFEHKPPAILSKGNLFLNNRAQLYKGKEVFNKIYQNLVAFIKPIMKHDRYTYRPDATSLTPLQKRDVLKDNDNFYFQNHRKVEQGVEEIKKIVAETKEAVRETPLSKHFQKDMDKAIKHHIDINRISDQVYQNIERRIRIEKERRGL